MKVALVVCCPSNRVIGRDNRIPWHLPADLKQFKRLTTGHTIVMGRKTYESLGKPLPNRQNVVFSRNGFAGDSGCRVISDVGELQQIVGEERCFVIGGEEIYQLFLGYADEIYHTLIETEEEIKGDAYFPISLEGNKDWRIDQDEKYPADERNRYDLHFRHLVRSY